MFFLLKYSDVTIKSHNIDDRYLAIPENDENIQRHLSKDTALSLNKKNNQEQQEIYIMNIRNYYQYKR
jgi:hypothetical protein